MAFDPARNINRRDMTVHSRILLFPLLNDGCAERITHFRISARQRVVQASPECGVVRNDETLSGRKQQGACHQDPC